jgi:peroxiredoxin Q/BCP
MLAIGDYAPTSLTPTGNDIFLLAEQRGKKVVVFFLPRVDTPGCTKEAKQFSALHDEFTAQNIEVIGVSKDKPDKQKKFCAKHCLTLLLGADHETKFC